MPIESYLFRARVGAYNFNLKSFKQKPDRHIKKGLFTMSINKSFKIPFFKILIFFLVIAFLNSSFILCKGISGSLAKSKLIFPDYLLTIMFFINNFKHLLLLLGDIEVNPGPKRSFNIKFCHWNLSGLAAHDFIKVPLIEAFITTNNFDIVCLSETFLDSTILDGDENIQINGYSLLRTNHPNDSKRGGVCIYFKESLPLIRGNDLTNIKDCLVTEFNVNNGKCFFMCLYLFIIYLFIYFQFI